jgi:hypothetical protein
VLPALQKLGDLQALRTRSRSRSVFLVDVGGDVWLQAMNPRQEMNCRHGLPQHRRCAIQPMLRGRVATHPGD